MWEFGFRNISSEYFLVRKQHEEMTYVEISKNIRAWGISLDAVQTGYRVELGNPWPPVRSLIQRRTVHLVQHPRDRPILDQVPETKAGSISPPAASARKVPWWKQKSL